MNYGVTPPGICKLFETKNVQAQLHLFSLSYLNQSQRQLLLKKNKVQKQISYFHTTIIDTTCHHS